MRVAGAELAAGIQAAEVGGAAVEARALVERDGGDVDMRERAELGGRGGIDGAVAGDAHVGGGERQARVVVQAHHGVLRERGGRGGEVELHERDVEAAVGGLLVRRMGVDLRDARGGARVHGGAGDGGGPGGVDVAVGGGERPGGGDAGGGAAADGRVGGRGERDLVGRLGGVAVDDLVREGEDVWALREGVREEEEEGEEGSHG